MLDGFKSANQTISECKQTLSEHNWSVLCIQRVGEDRLATGSLDTSIKIWDVSIKFKSIVTLNGHTESVNCLEMLSTNLLASG